MGNKLKELRNEKNLTQSELAEKMGVSQQLIAAWETERSIPRPQHMQVLEDYFQVEKEKIFFGAFNYKSELKSWKTS